MKHTAFIQIDLDGVWAVRRCYGMDEGGFLENDPVYEEGVPRFLDLLEKRNIRATFFIVGKDALIPKKKALIRNILAAGHEIGNHSFNHTLGLTRLSDAGIRAEIDKAQNALIEAVRSAGFSKERDPVGFRAPGYDVDMRVLKILKDLGLLYDASLFPTYWGFLMRGIDAYVSGRYFSGKRQYGSFLNGFRTLFPHETRGMDGFFEFPVSVSPVLRLPFHFGIARLRGFRYFQRIAEQYKKRGVPLLYLFHGVDFIDPSGAPLVPGKRGRGFFQNDIKETIDLAGRVLDYIKDNFNVTTARAYLPSRK